MGRANYTVGESRPCGTDFLRTVFASLDRRDRSTCRTCERERVRENKGDSHDSKKVFERRQRRRRRLAHVQNTIYRVCTHRALQSYRNFEFGFFWKKIVLLVVTLDGRRGRVEMCALWSWVTVFGDFPRLHSRQDFFCKPPLPIELLHCTLMRKKEVKIIPYVV